MKIIDSILVFLVMCVGNIAWAQNAESPVQKAPNPDGAKAAYLFGRANYFRVVTEQRRCDLLNNRLFGEINDRFETARSQLATLYGDTFFSANKPAGSPIREGACDSATLDSFGSKVSEIEQFLKSTQ